MPNAAINFLVTHLPSIKPVCAGREGWGVGGHGGTVSKVFKDQHELGFKAWIHSSVPRYEQFEQCARVKRNWCVVAGRVMGSAVSCTSSGH